MEVLHEFEKLFESLTQYDKMSIVVLVFARTDMMDEKEYMETLVKMIE